MAVGTSPMPSAPGILARGPWQPASRSRLSWRERRVVAPPADRRPPRPTTSLAALRERGSPSHDGLAARLAGFDARDGGLHLELSRPAGRCA